MLIIIVDDTGEYVDNWNELTTMLNNTLGPKKSIEDWKMVSSLQPKRKLINFIIEFNSFS